MASRVARRGTAVVIAGAAACALVLPAAAHGAEGPDPVITGSCGATLDDADSRARPLTADAGAAAEAPGVATIGLGTESEGTNGHRDPLLAVPVSDTLDDLGATRTPVVSDAATGACEVAKPAVNEAGSAVQNIVPIDDVTEPGPGTSPDGQPPGEQSPGNPPGATPGEGSGPGGVAGPIAVGPGFDGFGSLAGFGSFGGFGGLGAFGSLDLPAVLGGSIDALGAITLPPAVFIGPPVRAPDLNPSTRENVSPGDRTGEPGTAAAVPATGTQDRLPLLLAVIVLALVAAALSKTVHGRRAA